jgi:hypothetical protein
MQNFQRSSQHRRAGGAKCSPFATLPIEPQLALRLRLSGLSV